MKYKTLFRLALKFLGLWFVVDGIVDVMRVLVHDVVRHRMVGAPGIWWSANSYFGAVVQLAMGLYFLLGGEWIVKKIIPSNRPYCPECAYDLRGMSGDRCPECGTVISRENFREVVTLEANRASGENSQHVSEPGK